MTQAAIDRPSLVVGAGSIGRRHLRNLQALGLTQVMVCDPDPERLANLDPPIARFSDFREALATGQPEIVLICTPPVFHVPQALEAVGAGAHVFVEKPLSDRLDKIDYLIEEASRRSLIVQVGYNLRFNPGIRKLKQLIQGGVIGKVLWARLEMGQYLPDWRPWQDYRNSYSARQDLGGGIILDASHEIDYAIWLFGNPVEIVSMGGRVSGLEIDVEDCATLLLRFASGCQVDIHLDCIQRSYTRCCKIVGEQGTLDWNYSTGELKVFTSEAAKWIAVSYEVENNDVYVDELRHFLACVENGQEPLVDLNQGRRVLEVALAAKAGVARTNIL
jgi:predicted dehydrogenase